MRIAALKWIVASAMTLLFLVLSILQPSTSFHKNVHSLYNSGIRFRIHSVRNSRSNGVKTGTVLHAKKELVIWDCDGVLVDSEALLKTGEIEALAKGGFQLTVADCVRLFSGVSPDKATENFKAEYGKDLPPNFFKEQIAGSMQLFRDRLQPLMFNTVQKLHANKIPMCIASGSPRDRVLLCVDVAKLNTFLPPSVVFTREEVKLGKPAPDLFLHAANKMGYSPDKCVVVEDAASGIQAAQAANMHVIGSCFVVGCCF